MRAHEATLAKGTESLSPATPRHAAPSRPFPASRYRARSVAANVSPDIATAIGPNGGDGPSRMSDATADSRTPTDSELPPTGRVTRDASRAVAGKSSRERWQHSQSRRHARRASNWLRHWSRIVTALRPGFAGPLKLSVGRGRVRMVTNVSLSGVGKTVPRRAPDRDSASGLPPLRHCVAQFSGDYSVRRARRRSETDLARNSGSVGSGR